ncbi:uncharacterized protein AB675_2833 [Cyphellophora attinorum]|uniref:Uncharacterized protein n=1 Tax=Cyphellophora attinorum TaxID=1664694 RepID=A0A0N1HWV7_9EURO|nr:uncharacterized protein AB675_2833 [Phialophora attinorum]KPI44827.1 hypothetical protein AB675_2833 [Phialophora attinorum]
MLGILPIFWTALSLTGLATASAPWDGPSVGTADVNFVCSYHQLVGSKNGTGPEKTCSMLKPKFKDGKVTDSGVFAGEYKTVTTAVDPSPCQNISAAAIQDQSPSGDFVVSNGGCLKATGWTHLRVFGAPHCPVDPTEKAQTQLYHLEQVFKLDITKGQYFCIVPGFKVQSFLYLKP